MNHYEDIKKAMEQILLDDAVNARIEHHIKVSIDKRMENLMEKYHESEKQWRKLVLEEKERMIAHERHALCVEELLNKMIELMDKRL